MTIIHDNQILSTGTGGRQLDRQASSASPCIGHVHLKVSDLQRSTDFYRDVLGFTVTANGLGIGLPIVFLAFGDYHHHLALNASESAGGSQPSSDRTGLLHLAIVFPDEHALAAAVQRVFAHNYQIDSAEDHGGTLSVYLRDPDGIGVELYYDRPREEWYDAAGRPVLKAEPLDPRTLFTRLQATA